MTDTSNPSTALVPFDAGEALVPAVAPLPPTPAPLAPVAGPEGVRGFADSPPAVRTAFDEMSTWDPDAAQELETRWAGTSGQRLDTVANYAMRHPDALAALGPLADHPKVIEATYLLAVSEGVGAAPGRTAPMTGNPAQDFDTQLDSLRAQQEEQQALGNHGRANELYNREQALLAMRDGHQLAVGHGGRTA